MKKYLKTTLCLNFLLSALLLILFVAASYAEDFTFRVPVELKNIPDKIKVGFVQCGVTGLDGVVGGYVVLFDVIGGNYNQTVVVKFNADPGKGPASGMYYNCRIALKESMNSNPFRPSEFMKIDGPYPMDATQPFKEEVHGKLL